MSSTDHLWALVIIVPPNEHLVLLIMIFSRNEDKGEILCESSAFIFHRPGVMFSTFFVMFSTFFVMFNTGSKYPSTVQPISRAKKF